MAIKAIIPPNLPAPCQYAGHQKYMNATRSIWAHRDGSWWCCCCCFASHRSWVPARNEPSHQDAQHPRDGTNGTAILIFSTHLKVEQSAWSGALHGKKFDCGSREMCHDLHYTGVTLWQIVTWRKICTTMLQSFKTCLLIGTKQMNSYEQFEKNWNRGNKKCNASALQYVWIIQMTLTIHDVMSKVICSKCFF